MGQDEIKPPRFDTLASKPVARLREMARTGPAALMLDEMGCLMARRDPNCDGALLVAVYSGEIDDRQLLDDIISARMELARNFRRYVSNSR